MYVGSGRPCPCSLVIRQPKRPLTPLVVIELSKVCITSAITVRSDQCLKS